MSRGKKGKSGKSIRKLLIKEPRRKKKRLNEGKNSFGVIEIRFTNKVIDLMKEGYSSSLIKSYLNEDGVSPRMCNEYITQANKILSSEYSKKTLAAINVIQYNRDIKRLLATKELDKDDVGLDITWNEFMKARQRKITRYHECLDTMFQKEKCLQMHTSSFVVEITDEVNVTVVDRPKIDITKLTLQEQVELLELITKAKKGENEIGSVSEAIMNTSDAVDAVAEVIDSKLNITDIKQIEIPEIVKKGEFVADPAGKLKAALAKMAEEKLQKDNPSTGIKVIEQKIN